MRHCRQWPIVALLLLAFRFGILAQPLETIQDTTLLSYTVDTDVVVSGQFLPIGKAYSINAVEIIDKETIAKRAALNLEELLQQTLNIRFTQDAVLGGQIQMQGLQGNYVKIMVDGVPLIGRSDGNIDLARINLQNVERVELVEGPMSTAYGTNALGGTINIITKRFQNNRLEADFSTMAETVGRYNGSIGLGGKWKSLTMRANAAYNYFDGFSTDTLRSQAWNPKQQQLLDAFLRWDPSAKFHLKYSFRALQEQIDDLGDARLTNFPTMAYANDYQFLTRTLDHNLSFAAAPKEAYYLEGFLAQSSYYREKNAYYRALLDNQTADKLDSINSDSSRFSAWHLRTTIASDFRKKWDFQFGLDLRYEQAAGERIANPENSELPVSIGDYAVFSNLRFRPIKALLFQLGGRYAYNSRYQSPLTFSAQLRWSFEKYFSLRASYARGFRAPELKELYLDFVDSNHFIKGNPDLKAERSHNARLSLHFDKKVTDKQQCSLALSGFYNYIQNQIDLRDFLVDSTGTYIVATAPNNRFTYFNVAEFQSLGGDVKLHYQIQNLSIKFGAVLTGRFNSLSGQFDNVNPFSYTLEFNEELTYQLPKQGFTFSLFRKDFDKLIRYSTVYNPITQAETIVRNELGAYALMDFTFSKTFLKKKLRIGAGVRNLLNVTNIVSTGSNSTHSSTNTISPTAMGRSFFIQLNYGIEY